VKSAGFKRRAPRVKFWTADELPGARLPVVVPAVDAPIAPQPKDEPVRSEAYRRAVAALPCWRCGVAGRSQAAHGDEGKGMGIKSSDLTCWPACGPFGGLPGCHYVVGTSGLFTREYRRDMERRAAAETQLELILQAVCDPALRAVLVKVGLL
jgi:hypothetical protein